MRRALRGIHFQVCREEQHTHFLIRKKSRRGTPWDESYQSIKLHSFLGNRESSGQGTLKCDTHLTCAEASAPPLRRLLLFQVPCYPPAFRWCDKTLSQQATWGGKGSSGLCFLCHNPSLRQVRAGSQSRNLEAGLKQSLWQADTYLFAPPRQAQSLFDTTQSHLPMSERHSPQWAVSSKIFINQENVSQTCLQAGLFGPDSQMTHFSLRTPACIKLTKD